MKATVKMWVYWVQYDDMKPYLTLYESAGMGKQSPNWTIVREMDIDIEAPEDFDPRPQQIASLREKKKEVQAELQVKINNIDEQIQRLLAIENKS